jgi:hypothetical protein
LYLKLLAIGRIFQRSAGLSVELVMLKANLEIVNEMVGVPDCPDK